MQHSLSGLTQIYQKTDILQGKRRYMKYLYTLIVFVVIFGEFSTHREVNNVRNQEQP